MVSLARGTIGNRWTRRSIHFLRTCGSVGIGQILYNLPGTNIQTPYASMQASKRQPYQLCQRSKGFSQGVLHRSFFEVLKQKTASLLTLLMNCSMCIYKTGYLQGRKLSIISDSFLVHPSHKLALFYQWIQSCELRKRSWYISNVWDKDKSIVWIQSPTSDPSGKVNGLNWKSFWLPKKTVLVC